MKIWGLIVFFLFCTLSISVVGAQASDSYIAFVSKREENEDIFVTNLQGTQVYNLTRSRSRSWHPTWSPDGRRIAYNSDKDGNAEIYVMNANGTGKANLSKNPASDTSPDWSPVAPEIAFISDRDGGYDLYILNVDTDTTRRLTSDGAIKSEPDWSPDGTQIAFWQQVDQSTDVLQIITVATGDVRTLLDHGQNLWPAWSPKGKEIAYFSPVNGSTDIFAVQIDSGAVVDLTNNPANDARPDWSPDGAQIVFMSDRDGNFNLYTMNADGSNQQQLTDAPQDDHSPAWQPVPAAIVFDPSALGQNVNVVQGSVDSDAQSSLGGGKERLLAPEQANINDVIRVRFEIETDQAAQNATPEATLDPASHLTLRSTQALNVYRYMGAELIGLDIDRFDVFPNPTNYVLQVRDDGVNYWEWMLRPKNNDALGRNYLAVQVYLPEVDANGVVVRTDLDLLSFDVEVISGQPEVASAYTQPGLETEDKEGFSVYYSDRDAFSIVFSNDMNVADMTIANDQVEFPILGDFPTLHQTDDQASANTCLVYDREGTESALPRACRSGNAFELALNPGDVFWYNQNARQLRDVIIRKDQRVYVCRAGADRCDF